MAETILSKLSQIDHRNSNPVTKCVRCFGGGRLFLPALTDWKTYVLTKCPMCNGEGQNVRHRESK